jgi:alpha-beta hydrolase superfamily lysophospholipase
MAEYLDFDVPPGLRVRGTVLVVPGRGETSASYRRFGSRIAADSYRVRVLPEPQPAETATASLRALTDALTSALRGLDAELVRPLVLVGADAAAATLAALVARGSSDSVWWPDALVLAALPGYGIHDVDGGWESELDVRTHCPVQRGVLTEDAAFHRGTLTGAVADELLDLAYGSTVDVPQLLLVGDADPLADRESLASAAKLLPAARLSVVHSAHHDVLNDLQHRSVAAEVVTFLEVVRNGVPLRPIVTRESSAW